jgi:hypothetical protein
VPPHPGAAQGGTRFSNFAGGHIYIYICINVSICKHVNMRVCIYIYIYIYISATVPLAEGRVVLTAGLSISFCFWNLFLFFNSGTPSGSTPSGCKSFRKFRKD